MGGTPSERVYIRTRTPKFCDSNINPMRVYAIIIAIWYREIAMIII